MSKILLLLILSSSSPLSFAEEVATELLLVLLFCRSLVFTVPEEDLEGDEEGLEEEEEFEEEDELDEDDEENVWRSFFIACPAHLIITCKIEIKY